MVVSAVHTGVKIFQATPVEIGARQKFPYNIPGPGSGNSAGAMAASSGVAPYKYVACRRKGTRHELDP